MEQIYSFDNSKLIKRLTPPRWRNKFNLEWFECLLSPMEYSQERFENYREDSLRLLSYNGQVIYMQKMLNDYFDSSERRILILDSESDEVYLYNESEGQDPKYLYLESETGITATTYLRNEGEVASELENYDFIVQAPASLSGSTLQMSSYVNLYKLAGMTYTINFS